jgi:hypothetical protein
MERDGRGMISLSQLPDRSGQGVGEIDQGWRTSMPETMTAGSAQRARACAPRALPQA